MLYAQVKSLCNKTWGCGFSFWSPVVLNTIFLQLPISVPALTSKSRLPDV